MSVDFYECDCCEESRYEEYVGSCMECGHRLCSWCLGNKGDINSPYASSYGILVDGTVEQAAKYGFDLKYYEVGEIYSDDGIDSKYCPYCNGSDVHNDDLLEYLMDKYKINKEDLIKEYANSK